MKILRVLVPVVIVAAAVISCNKNSNPVSSAPTYHLIARSDSLPYGYSWEDWQARWWNWFFSMPITANPLYDNAPISAGQSGSVWFLGGVWLSSPNSTIRRVRTRSGTISRGSALFFPVYNTWCDTTDIWENQGKGWPTVEEAVAFENASWDALKVLSESADIDGNSIPNVSAYHVFAAKLFTLNLPYGEGPARPTVTPAAATGDYLMIDSLSVGQHKIHFFADDGQYQTDITYLITVQ